MKDKQYEKIDPEKNNIENKKKKVDQL